jgi:hypothetical protein
MPDRQCCGFGFGSKSGSALIWLSWIWIQISIGNADLGLKNSHKKVKSITTSSIVSLDPQIPTRYISVGTCTYSPHQCSTWIHKYLHTCRYRYLLTSSMQHLDPQIPTTCRCLVSTYPLSAVPGSADTYISVRYRYLRTSSVQGLDP